MKAGGGGADLVTIFNVHCILISCFNQTRRSFHTADRYDDMTAWDVGTPWITLRATILSSADRIYSLLRKGLNLSSLVSTVIIFKSAIHENSKWVKTIVKYLFMVDYEAIRTLSRPRPSQQPAGRVIVTFRGEMKLRRFMPFDKLKW